MLSDCVREGADKVIVALELSEEVAPMDAVRLWETVYDRVPSAWEIEPDRVIDVVFDTELFCDEDFDSVRRELSDTVLDTVAEGGGPDADVDGERLLVGLGECLEGVAVSESDGDVDLETVTDSVAVQEAECVRRRGGDTVLLRDFSSVGVSDMVSVVVSVREAVAKLVSDRLVVGESDAKDVKDRVFVPMLSDTVNAAVMDLKSEADAVRSCVFVLDAVSRESVTVSVFEAVSAECVMMYEDDTDCVFDRYCGD